MRFAIGMNTALTLQEAGAAFSATGDHVSNIEATIITEAEASGSISQVSSPHG